MKICFLTNTLNVDSGWGRYSWNIVSRVKKGNEVVVLTEKEDEYSLGKAVLRNAFGGNDFKIFRFLAILTNALQARKYLKGCDIVHCLDAYPYGIIGALANVGLNKKLVIGVVGSYSVAPLDHWLKGFLLKWAYRKADSVPCISFFVQKQVLKRIKIKTSHVVHLGVDFDRFQRKNMVKGEKDKKKVILGVGELKRRKGYHISISAMAKIKEKYPDFKYYIVGHQDNKVFFGQLKELAVKNHLQDNVVFLEKISDEKLIDLYYQSDLFLLTPVNVGCHFEGFGLVYLEANACGRPVVGTYDCGAEEIIQDGYNGFLVPQNDPEKTSEAVLKILENDQLAEKMGENGKKKAKEMNWEETIRKYLKMYQLIR